MHGRGRTKESEYLLQLREKQKARYAYGILEKQVVPQFYQRDIDGLKLKRRDVETSLEASIQALRNTLEFVREQDGRERDEKLLQYRPRLAEAELKVG